jgi:DNA-binding MarR family transcriptional regulator
MVDVYHYFRDSGGMGDGRRVAPISEIVDLLFELTDQIKANFAAVTAGLQLTAPQARTLLRIDGPASMRELAARIGYDASNMTGIVEALRRRGLVERQTLPADRRVKQVVLTEHGHRLQEQLRHSLGEAMPALGRLDDADRKELHGMLRRGLGR